MPKRPALTATLRFLLILGVAAAPAASAPQPDIPVPFVTLATGNRSAITVPTQAVITDAAAWTALWRRHTGQASTPPPAVDFGTHIVIAIFAGRTPPSTAVAIMRILSEAERLAVYYRQGERRPLPMPEDVEATPFHIVRVLSSARAVRFVLLKTPPVLRPGPGS